MDIRNKVALITGSSRGVGRSVAQQLAARGCRVVINHRDSEDQAQETLGWIESHGGKAIILRADVSEESACRSLVNQTIAHWGQLDQLALDWNKMVLCNGIWVWIWANLVIIRGYLVFTTGTILAMGQLD